MTTRRTAKLAEAVRESVSTTVLFGLKDPRVKNVTVLRAEMSPDLRAAKVYFTVRGTDKDAALCLHGLQSARGFIQAKLADRLQTRYTPILTFVLDDEVKKSITASAIISKLLTESGTPLGDGTQESAAADPTAGDDFAAGRQSVDELSGELAAVEDDEFFDDDEEEFSDDEEENDDDGQELTEEFDDDELNADGTRGASVGLKSNAAGSSSNLPLPGAAAGESPDTPIPPAPS